MWMLFKLSTLDHNWATCFSCMVILLCWNALKRPLVFVVASQILNSKFLFA
uniref:Uncharacterized protein n=1 Tax=Rhizophora mucronata TaxID=61149 RepID=A0A2P2PUG1_RHIMU